MPPRAPLSFDPVEEARRQWHAHGWHEAADAMAVVTSVMRVQQLFMAQVDALLRPHQLTFARFEVLRLLAFTRAGALPLGKIGTRLQVHAASVTNAVDRLEQQGLVARVSHPTDGRTTLASITEEGRAVVERATAELNEEAFARLALPGDDMAALIRILAAVRRQAGDFA